MRTKRLLCEIKAAVAQIIEHDGMFLHSFLCMEQQRTGKRMKAADGFVAFDYQIREKAVSGQLCERNVKQRILIAQALLNDPQILILDEPTAGLDPAGRDEIFELVRNYHAQSSATILIVSHSMEDISQIADRLLVMDHARVLFCDTPREVFSHADEIVAAGLDIPMITKVMIELKKRGHDVDTSVYTVAQAMDALRACRKKGGAH